MEKRPILYFVPLDTLSQDNPLRSTISSDNPFCFRDDLRK